MGTIRLEANTGEYFYIIDRDPKTLEATKASLVKGGEILELQSHNFEVRSVYDVSEDLKKIYEELPELDLLTFWAIKKK